MTEQQRQQMLAVIRNWQVNPLQWVLDMFGDNIRKSQESKGAIRDGRFVHTDRPATKSGLSYQQEDALRKWGDFLKAKLDRANNLPHDADLAAKIGMSIQSSNGNGKDFIAAIITWHFNYCFADCKCAATANTKDQLREVFWSEMANVRRLAKSNGTDANELVQSFEMQTEMMYNKQIDKADHGKLWFTTLRTVNKKATPDEQGETLAGLHADHMLFVIDEASGIPDPVFKPIDRTLTGKLNVVFMIFNPTQNNGFAIESQTKKADQWVCLQWDAIDSDNVSREQIARLKKYGEDHPQYRIGVLGLPPIAGKNNLIPWEWIQEAIEREIDPDDNAPIMAGVDVGLGGDRSVVCFRQGGKILGIERNGQKDTMDIADWAGGLHIQEEFTVCFVDVIGVGAGVYDRMKQKGINCRPADVRSSANLRNANRFLNKRAEMYFDLREQFENKTISIPNDPELINELACLKWEESGSRIKIRDKREIRRELGSSPDLADALALSYFKPDHIFSKQAGRNTHTVNFSDVFMR